MTPVDLTPFQPLPNQPVKLEVKKKKNSKFEQASSLHLISVLNARSLYPKKDNFKSFVTELGIEIALVSETWEREEESLEELLQLEITKYFLTKDQKLK